MKHIKICAERKVFADVLEEEIINALQAAGLLKNTKLKKSKPSLKSCNESTATNEYVKVEYSLGENIVEVMAVLKDLNMGVALITRPFDFTPAEEAQTLLDFLKKDVAKEFCSLAEYGAFSYSAALSQFSFEAFVMYKIGIEERGQKVTSAENFRETFGQVLKKIPEEDKKAGIAEKSVTFKLRASYKPQDYQVWVPEKFWKLHLAGIDWKGELKPYISNH